MKVNVEENRYNVTPLDLAQSMRHWECVDFLIEHADKKILNSSLQWACTEGILHVVQKSIEHGADM